MCYAQGYCDDPCNTFVSAMLRSMYIGCGGMEGHMFVVTVGDWLYKTNDLRNFVDVVN